MGIEIERKFLVNAKLLEQWQESTHEYLTTSFRFVQGYLSRNPWVRIRIIDNQRAELTVKGSGSVSRQEFNYDIPLQDALDMNPLMKGVIEKVRYHVKYQGHMWEVDRFDGPLSGLWLAEIELPSEDTVFDVPPWATHDVSHVGRYTNSKLARLGLPCGCAHPNKGWKICRLTAGHKGKHDYADGSINHHPPSER